MPEKIYYEKVLADLMGKLDVSEEKCRNSEAIIIRGAGKVHVRILSSDTKEVRKKGGQVNGRSN